MMPHFPDTKNATDNPALTYRPDIDGMRALAVLAVVIYHYAPTRLPGGFIGVDIFFVISGYLITGILLQAFRTRTFSLLDFYQRRIRRIFPALAAVLIFCLLTGWLLLFPFEYQALGKHAAAGAGFVQNLVLWRESGYFDTSALQKPLLHLWSLAVEEQFYIVWPLALWLILRGRQPLLISVSLIAGLSFALNIWGIHTGHSVPTFYLPLTRAWELMAGAGLAALHSGARPGPRHFGTAQSCAGLGLIHAGPQASVNRWLLALRPMVAVGLISYPLYLWHWSLLSLTAIIFTGSDLTLVRGIKLTALCLSFLLAWATYRWLEQPIRHHRRATATMALTALVAMTGGAGLLIWQAGGLADRPGSPISQQATQLLSTMRRSPEAARCFDLTDGPVLPEAWSCDLGDRTAPDWIMAYGDSHALSMLPALDRYGKEARVRVVFAGLSGCPGLLDVEPHRASGPACVALASQTLARVEKDKAAAAVLIQRWSYYAGGTTQPDDIQTIHARDERRAPGATPITGISALRHGLDATLSRYQAMGVPILLVEDSPQQMTRFPIGQLRFGSLSSQTLNASSVSRAEHERNQAPFNQLLRSMAGRYPVVSLLNNDQALCTDRQCPWIEDGQFLYFDDDHLSIAGAMRVYPGLADTLNRMLGKNR